MVYNPVLHKWEGNDDMMVDFEHQLAPRTQPRPALITNVGGNKTMQRIGDMTFDPVKMCWVGNEEEALDVFAELENEERIVSQDNNTATKGSLTFYLSFSIIHICVAVFHSEQ